MATKNDREDKSPKRPAQKPGQIVPISSLPRALDLLDGAETIQVSRATGRRPQKVLPPTGEDWTPDLLLDAPPPPGQYTLVDPGSGRTVTVKLEASISDGPQAGLRAPSGEMGEVVRGLICMAEQVRLAHADDRGVIADLRSLVAERDGAISSLQDEIANLKAQLAAKDNERTGADRLLESFGGNPQIQVALARKFGLIPPE